MTAGQGGQGKSNWRRHIRQFAPGLDLLLHYDRSWLRGDLAGGISVAAVAIPMGIALAGIVRVPVEYGLYASIFPMFGYALFGSSRQVIVGPDSATCVLVAAALWPLAGESPERYIALMVLLSAATGLILVVAGLLRLGFIANFLSQPILTGLLNGIALVMIAGQLRNILGVAGEARGFFPRLVEAAEKAHQAHLPTFALGAGLFVAIMILRRVLPRWPVMLIGMVAGALIAYALQLQEHGVALIGEVRSGLPSVDLVVPTFKEFRTLLADSTAIALLVFVSGILTVQACAQRTRQDVDPHQELVGLGAANLFGASFQGFAVSGSTSRTMINLASGASSQLAGLVAALVILAVLAFFTAPIAYLPTVSLAAVIIVTGIGILDFAGLRELYGTNRIEFFVCIAATIGVLVLGVLPGFALTVGMSLAWLLYVEARPSDAILGQVEGMRGYYDIKRHGAARTEPGVLIYRFNANLVFYNSDYFKRRVRQVVANYGRPVKWVILDASAVNYIDVTGSNRFHELRDELGARGIELVLANLKSEASRHFVKGWTEQRAERMAGRSFPTIKMAVKAYKTLKSPGDKQP